LIIAVRRLPAVVPETLQERSTSGLSHVVRKFEYETSYRQDDIYELLMLDTLEVDAATSNFVRRKRRCLERMFACDLLSHFIFCFCVGLVGVGGL